MGLFKCGVHNYTCDVPQEFREHLEAEAHGYVGQGECNQCGKVISYDIMVKVKADRNKPLVLCEDCKK